MNFRGCFGRVLCGTGLALALATVPASWASSPTQRGDQTGPKSAMHSAVTRLDINAATADQLKSLPGMGIVYAKRIIAGRPYRSKNELLTKGILPQSVYDKIKDDVIAHRVRK